MEKESALLWAGIKKYEDILARDPMAYSFAPLADIYRKLGLLDEAVAIARRGVALHPDFASGQMSLAIACLEKGMADEARDALEAVVRVTPENLDAQRMLAGLHASAGNAAASEQCLRIVADLEPDTTKEFAAYPSPAEPVAAAVTVGAAPAQAFIGLEEEELLDADILELTDDLIEEESYTDESFAPFAASPERPSQQAARETFLVEQTVAAPEFEPPVATAVEEFQIEEPEMAQQAEGVPQPAVMTATIAELFISQGMIDKGVGVYRELLRESPDNEGYMARLQELTAPPEAAVVESPAETAAFSGVPDNVSQPITRDAVGVLEGWLSNIGRMRECRTESH